MADFLIEYRHRGDNYSAIIAADNWPDAEERIRAIGSSGRVCGSDVIRIPVNSMTMPFAGLLARLIVWFKNLRRI